MVHIAKDITGQLRCVVFGPSDQKQPRTVSMDYNLSNMNLIDDTQTI